MSGDTGAAPVRVDKLAVAALLIVVIALAWAYTVLQTLDMQAMEVAMKRDSGMSMNDMRPSWGLADTALMFAMWTVMMAAMMVPGATPMVTAFATINRRRRQRSAPYVPTAVFLAGYVAAWAAFSVAATALQWLLQRTGLLTTMMESASVYFSAALLIIAGLYQFSAFKQRCLNYCRSPDGFILSEWRDGPLGAVVMGFRHGLFCMGCCAALMLLLFAFAVMDLRWVALLTVLVTLEKVLPGEKILRPGIGIGLMIAAAVLILANR